MKRFRLTSLIAPATALVVASSFIACEKTSDKPAQQPQADAAKVAEATKAPEVAKVIEAVKAVVAPASDAAKLAGQYGFAAMLPRDVDGFATYYHLHEMWAALANSKWAAELMAMQPIKENPQVQQALQQWKSPQGEKGRELLEAVFGAEFSIVLPTSFGEKMKPLMDVYTKLMETYFQRAIMASFSGKPMTPEQTQQMLRDAAPEMLPMLAKCDFPPMLFIAKAVKSKVDIDAAFKNLTAMVGVQLPPAFEVGSFKVADKYEFQSLHVSAKKLVPPQVEPQLKEMLGDEAKAKEAMGLITSKNAELAWGWVGDSFVVSFGADHSHVRFAASAAESALSIPAVAQRAAQYAEKNPGSLGYMSKAILEKFGTKISFVPQFNAISEELGSILKPEQITGMRNDVQKLEGKAKEIFTSQHDDMVGVGYYENGLHSETYGGARFTAMLDAGKPLTFASLAGPAAFVLLDSRSSANSVKVTDFIEDAAVTAWSWYEKYGRTMVPEGERQGVTMVEMMALPMVKQLWNSSRTLGKALGSESAFVFDLGGAMPKLPDMPPFLAEGKIPRLAWVSEMRDRAGVSEAWKGFSSLIKQLAALAPQGAVPEPQMKKDGDTELHFIPLPIPTDDLLPHIAITKDRWIISTSPSLTSELAAKPATAGAQALSTDMQVNFGALWNLADVWLKVADQNIEKMFGPADAKEFQQMRPVLGTALKLARSIVSGKMQLTEEVGQSRASAHLKLEDIR